MSSSSLLPSESTPLPSSTNTTNTNTTETSITTTKRKKKSAYSQSKVNFWASECKYSVILDTVNSLEWRLIQEERLSSKVNLFWIDVATIHEHFRSITTWQCINHFPGMPNIARKNRMGQNLNRLLKLFPREYSFYPRTWVLPSELNDFRSQFDSNGNALNNRIYIVKPDTGCQGRGIFLTKNLDNVPMNENVVAQVYIKKPLLLDGYKFDLRIYCFVTSVKPLRIYLFQDGLVRMCTEEYVKPTKENIHNSCMHLTNYAVNKHNDNFQQPDLNDGNDGEAGHKRSLSWFMNWVRTERGDQKAEWLWKRIGTLCTRTILSILPTLSREYDQHFKGFSGIPVDMSKIGVPSTPVPPTSNSGLNTPVGEEVDEAGENTPVENTEKPSVTTEEDSQDDSNPKIRGSRCFEVLGFDVMLDSNLNPWLIEVNHLPSFGTDSPLDRDVKERLMKEVFSVLAVMPDDYAAFQAFNKAESEKRLQAQRVKEVTPPPPEKKPKPQPIRRDPPKTVTQAVPEKVEPELTPQPRVLSAAERQALRLAEIKEILITIYTQYSPEKIPKIDRLLAKYIGHEEEFLFFVYSKYNVNPQDYPSKLPTEQPSETASTENLGTKNGTENNDGNEESAEPNSAADTDQTAGVIKTSADDLATTTSEQEKARQAAKEAARRRARSMSPPRNQSLNSGRRPLASWKQAPDEEEAFRAEVLATHVPDENDEWMRFEMSRLTQFTRIFPILKPAQTSGSASASNGIAAGEEEAEEAEEAVEEGDATSNTVTPVENTKKKKSATFEEILYQVFLADRRQTMRLRNPLPNRTKAEEQAANGVGPYVPPETNAAKSTMGNGRAVGWKAPPKPKEQQQTKQPTAAQLETAKRLSQGLSSMNTARQRSNSLTSGDALSAYGGMMYDSNGEAIEPSTAGLQQGIAGDSSADASRMWQTTRANRLYEESRANRIRIEQARANNAAVLRQQVFFFDTNGPPDSIDALAAATQTANEYAQAQQQQQYQQSQQSSLLFNGVGVGANSVRMAGGNAAGNPLLANTSGKSSRNPTVYAKGVTAPGGILPSRAIESSGPRLSVPSNPRQEELLRQLFPSWF